MEIEKVNKAILQNLVFSNLIKIDLKKSCPLSVKGAPKIDYKNIKLLKKYMSENGKILPSRITNVSQKQRELSISIKRARNLALIYKGFNESNFIRKFKKIGTYWRSYRC